MTACTIHSDTILYSILLCNILYIVILSYYVILYNPRCSKSPAKHIATRSSGKSLAEFGVSTHGIANTTKQTKYIRTQLNRHEIQHNIITCVSFYIST
jgi:hypothetical protein